jgi:serine/threonine protein kinase
LQIKKRSELQNSKIFPGDCEMNDNIVTAKIADFGLSAEVNANIANNSSKINEIMGTMLYMAPE